MSLTLWMLLFAMITTMAFVLVLTPLASRLGLVDEPSFRKHHQGSIPMAGGPAIALSLLLLAILLPWPADASWLAVGMVLIFSVGLIDDWRSLPASARFYIQILAAICSVIGGNAVFDLDQTFTSTTLQLGILAAPFTIVAIVGVINAYNMTDGMDGLCGGTTMISIVWLLIAGEYGESGLTTQAISQNIVLPMIGILLGFLVFNSRYFGKPRATVFLGDSGSMMLGFFVAWLAIHTTQSGQVPAVVAVWILAVPLIDMISSMIRRICNGVTPLTADRQHLHHLLTSKGFSHRSTVGIEHTLIIASGGFGVITWQQGMPQYISFWSLVAILSLYSTYAFRHWRRIQSYSERAENQINATR